MGFYSQQASDEDIIHLLNELQQLKKIKILNYEFPITVSVRKSLEKHIASAVEGWIKEWSDLWKGKSSEGYYLSNPPKENLKRMLEFMTENPEFDKETIFAATKKYLNEKELVNFQYCKKSNKFITDSEGSVLYGYCCAIQLGEETKRDKTEAI